MQSANRVLVPVHAALQPTEENSPLPISMSYFRVSTTAVEVLHLQVLCFTTHLLQGTPMQDILGL